MSKKIDLKFFDEDPVVLEELPAVFTLECCDCGLVHLVLVEKIDKGIELGFFRDDKTTELIRENKKLKKKK